MTVFGIVIETAINIDIGSSVIDTTIDTDMSIRNDNRHRYCNIKIHGNSITQTYMYIDIDINVMQIHIDTQNMHKATSKQDKKRTEKQGRVHTYIALIP